MAPALLFLVPLMTTLSACFNPLFIGEVQARENHAPFAVVAPAPTNEPLAVSINPPGDEKCQEVTLDMRSLEDADGDELTVLWSILRTRNGTPGQRREIDELPPLPPQEDGTYPLGTKATQLLLNDGAVGEFIGAGEFQLIELRISDTGFVNDALGVPVPAAGGGLFFASWLVQLAQCVDTGGDGA